MRLQRYPDGPMHWIYNLWGRHPDWSRTWTHHVSLTRYRKSTGISLRPRLIRPMSRFQREYGVQAFRFKLSLMRQDPERRKANA